MPEAAGIFSTLSPSRYFRNWLTLFVTRRIFDKFETNTRHPCLPNAVCTEEAAMKMFSTLSRFIYQPEPPQPTAAPFDDGLAEIARLIAREDPVKADALSAPRSDGCTVKAK